MAKVAGTLECDGVNCHQLRSNDTNHWFAGFEQNGKLVVETLEQWTELHSWEKEVKVEFFCGENCTTKWFVTKLGRLRG